VREEAHHGDDGFAELEAHGVPGNGDVAVPEILCVKEGFEVVDGLVFGFGGCGHGRELVPEPVEGRVAVGEALEEVGDVASDPEEHHFGGAGVRRGRRAHRGKEVAVVDVGGQLYVADEHDAVGPRARELLRVAFEHHDLPPEAAANLYFEGWEVEFGTVVVQADTLSDALGNAGPNPDYLGIEGL
jgi:hypothetical protein